MKGTLFLLLIAIIFNTNLRAQYEPVRFKLEKITFKFSFNSGIYKSRLSGASDKENSFKNISFFAQVYFPFKRSLDIPKNFNKSEGDSIYFERLFSISPMAVLQFTEKGGNAVGMGQEMSFKIAKNYF